MHAILEGMKIVDQNIKPGRNVLLISYFTLLFTVKVRYREGIRRYNITLF